MKFWLLPLSLLIGILIGGFAFRALDSSVDKSAAPVGLRPDENSPRPAPAPKAEERETSGGEERAGGLNFDEKVAYFAEMDTQPSLSENLYALELMQQMNPRELAAALEVLRGRNIDSIHDYLIPRLLFRALLEVDLDEAEAYYMSMDDRGMKHIFREILYPMKAEKNLSESIRMLDTIEDSNERQRALGLIVESMAESSPVEAYQLLESRDDSQPWAYHRLFAKWAENDPEAARAQLQKLPGGDIREQALTGFIGTWAEDDPVRAGAFAKSLENFQERQTALRTVSRSMIRKHLESGLEFIFGIEDSQTRTKVLQRNIHAIANRDPHLAFEYVQAHLSGRAQDNALSTLISTLARKDVDEAIAMMDQLPYGRAYQSAVSQPMGTARPRGRPDLGPRTRRRQGEDQRGE